MQLKWQNLGLNYNSAEGAVFPPSSGKLNANLLNLTVKITENRPVIPRDKQHGFITVFGWEKWFYLIIQ